MLLVRTFEALRSELALAPAVVELLPGGVYLFQAPAGTRESYAVMRPADAGGETAWTTAGLAIETVPIAIELLGLAGFERANAAGDAVCDRLDRVPDLVVAGQKATTLRRSAYPAIRPVERENLYAVRVDYVLKITRKIGA